MAKKGTTSPRSPAAKVTSKRAARLYQLLSLLGKGPQRRDTLVRRLGHGIRGFYRDLEVLRKVGIKVLLDDGGYTLAESVAQATAQLPFPDPALTLGEAIQLARGRTRAHQKLNGQIQVITGSGAKKRKPRG